jgi:hypothetical protein
MSPCFRFSSRDDLPSVPQLKAYFTIDAGLPERTLRAAVCRATIGVLLGSRTPLGAVTALFYAGPTWNRAGPPTGARVVYVSPGGWDNPDPSAPLCEWKMTVDVSPEYLRRGLTVLSHQRGPQ